MLHYVNLSFVERKTKRQTLAVAVAEQWQAVARFAWLSYLGQGQGTVVVSTRRAPQPDGTCEMRFANEAVLSRIAGAGTLPVDPGLLSAVRSYDPAREVVFLWWPPLGKDTRPTLEQEAQRGGLIPLRTPVDDRPVFGVFTGEPLPSSADLGLDLLATSTLAAFDNFLSAVFSNQNPQQPQ